VTAQRNFVVSLVLAVMMAWAVQVAYGQGMRGYNPNTEITVKGTVEAVKTIYFPGGGGSEQARRPFGPIHIDLKSDSGLFQVDLGPSSFMESKGFKFAKGDQIEVTGSKLQDKNAIIAREVKEGDKVLTLRNAQGTPEWSERSLQ
jgi:hypothetical protein